MRKRAAQSICKVANLRRVSSKAFASIRIIKMDVFLALYMCIGRKPTSATTLKNRYSGWLEADYQIRLTSLEVSNRDTNTKSSTRLS